MNRQTISTINPEAIFLDDAFDQAILGVANDADGDLVAVYSQKQCISILNVDGIEDEDFEFIETSRGKGAPIIFTELWDFCEH